MDPLQLAEELQKELKNKEQQVQETYMSGGLKNNAIKKRKL